MEEVHGMRTGVVFCNELSGGAGHRGSVRLLCGPANPTRPPRFQKNCERAQGTGLGFPVGRGFRLASIALAGLAPYWLSSGRESQQGGK